MRQSIMQCHIRPGKVTEMKTKKILKIIAIILAVILLLFAIVCAIWHDAAKAVFYNLTATSLGSVETDDWSGGQVYENVQYSDVSENDYVNIYVPDGIDNPPLIVVVHGGGFITDDNKNRPAQRVYRYFRDHGFACASVNYRLAQEAAYPAALEDVKACIRYLRANADKYGYNADSITITGESAGGYLASAVALSSDDQFNDLEFIGESDLYPDVDGEYDAAPDVEYTKISAKVDTLIDFYGATYFREADEMWDDLHIPGVVLNIANSWISGDVLQGYEDVHSYWLRKNASELTDEEYRDIKMTGFIEDNLTEDSDLKVYISHGDCDITVPYTVSQLFYDELTTKLPADQVVLNIVKNAGHAGDLIYTDEELEKISEFILE